MYQHGLLTLPPLPMSPLSSLRLFSLFLFDQRRNPVHPDYVQEVKEMARSAAGDNDEKKD